MQNGPQKTIEDIPDALEALELFSKGVPQTVLGTKSMLQLDGLGI